MTRLFVDQKEVPPPPLGFQNLNEVLKHVEEAHLSSGR